jgi:phosphoheptose isomerase
MLIRNGRSAAYAQHFATKMLVYFGLMNNREGAVAISLAQDTSKIQLAVIIYHAL